MWAIHAGWALGCHNEVRCCIEPCKGSGLLRYHIKKALGDGLCARQYPHILEMGLAAPHACPLVVRIKLNHVVVGVIAGGPRKGYRECARFIGVGYDCLTHGQLVTSVGGFLHV